MRTITSTARPRQRAWLSAMALALAVCSLLVASTARAQYSTVNAITGGSQHSSQLDGGSGHSSINSITGASSSEPTPISGSPATSDGFDWLSAAIGAAAAMGLVALTGAAFLTVRKRAAVSPSPASTS
jgi:hypothetical protein